MKKSELHKGFVRLPVELFQAGWPLKLDLYRYTPMRNRLEVFGKKGDVIELDAFLEVSQNPTVLILVEEDSLTAYREDHSPWDLSVDPGELEAA
jgi:hypothetical protein